MLLCMAVSVFAQKSVLFDFAASGDGLPTAATTEETYTYNGYEFTMQNCKYSEGYNGGANYLMVYQVGKGAKIDGYVTLPSFDFKIGSGMEYAYILTVFVLGKAVVSGSVNTFLLVGLHYRITLLLPSLRV